jgi:hypothetical protein
MYVPQLKFSHRPDGKVADVLASTHAFTTANALVNYSGGACLRNLEKFPSPSWECLADMNNLTLAIRLGSNLVLPGMGMCQPCLQIPIAPMGNLLTRLPQLTLAQLRTLRSTTGGACRRDL